MVVHVQQFAIRSAQLEDTRRLANLIHFEAHVHRHLDWRPPLDWVGRSPYLLAERGTELLACLACPPDPPGVAWIRLFAAAGGFPLQAAWEELWAAAQVELRALETGTTVAAIPLQSWFRVRLEASGFAHSHQVVVLNWKVGPAAEAVLPNGVTIRPMSLEDLPATATVDAAAFGAIWQNSLECLQDAYRQASLATVAELDGSLVGYQICTGTSMGGHLARLAVLPAFQGRGIGAGLVADVQVQFLRRAAHHLTVNTQHDNYSSLALYERAGFRRTGEEYPVYQLHISSV